MEEKMLDIENLLNNLITENEYDRRLIPYIKEFFRYNAKQYGWDSETITRKFGLLKQRIHGIEFVNLEDRFAYTDFEFKNILVNSFVKGKNLSQEELLKLTSDIFRRLEIATKDVEEHKVKYLEKRSLYPLEALKYSTNEKDKQSIIQFISNAFNIDAKDVYRIEEIFEQKLKDNKNIDKDNKNFLEDSLTTFLPSISNAVSRIMSGARDVDKSEEYLSIYAISMLVIRYRLENEIEDKELLKGQYTAITKAFMEKAEEYVITADRLRIHNIDSTFAVNIEATNQKISDALGSIELRQAVDRKETVGFKNGLSKEFIQEATSITETEVLEDTYIEQQVSKVLPIYGGRFGPIVQEYLTRTAKVYNWTKDEFDKKVRNYLKNIKSIEFVKKLEGHEISTMGFWSQKEKKFCVKDDTFLVRNDEILDVFFHEQEHATDVTIRNNEKELERDIDYASIKEYATEIGAIHLLGDNVYEDELCFTHKMQGYNDIRYAGSMMAAALGISEFEFAKLRDKGNRQFIEKFQQRFGYIDIQEEIEEFNDILANIINAPSIINMRQMSEAYASMYNMADRIIRARLEHESREVSEENQSLFELKSKYEMIKIARNMNLAKRKLNLRDKYIIPIIEDDTIIVSYSKLTSKDRKKYLALVEELYPEKNIRFDNRDLLQHINREFKHPIRRKISNLFARRNVLMLNTPITEEKILDTSNGQRRKMQENLRKGIKVTPTVSMKDVNKGRMATELTRDEE